MRQYMTREQEIERRRTFAIISHPDAGKTTLTEKLLLFGGGIRTAGAVKSNKIKKAATSDFMEIEKQRGISVATAVMSFDYDGKLINILDTPGHKDFAEDTYRTLTAVDSVILVVDSVKGVEEQTEKLMQVCRMRDTPVIIFVNKLDREGRPPVELMDEIEEKLEIQLRPMTWPINMGQQFKGVYNLHERDIFLFRPGKTVVEEERLHITDLDDPELDRQIGSDAGRLRDDVELIEGVYEPFSVDAYRAGDLAPVFFGSALNNFGVRELLETFIAIAPKPVSRPARTRNVSPTRRASPASCSRSTPTSTRGIATGSRFSASARGPLNDRNSFCTCDTGSWCGLPTPTALWRRRRPSSTTPTPVMSSASTTGETSRSATPSPRGRISSFGGFPRFRRQSSGR
jgi:peptide chain release factor 3